MAKGHTDDQALSRGKHRRLSNPSGKVPAAAEEAKAPPENSAKDMGETLNREIESERKDFLRVLREQTDLAQRTLAEQRQLLVAAAETPDQLFRAELVRRIGDVDAVLQKLRINSRQLSDLSADYAVLPDLSTHIRNARAALNEVAAETNDKTNQISRGIDFGSSRTIFAKTNDFSVTGLVEKDTILSFRKDNSSLLSAIYDSLLGELPALARRPDFGALVAAVGRLAEGTASGQIGGPELERVGRDRLLPADPMNDTHSAQVGSGRSQRTVPPVPTTEELEREGKLYSQAFAAAEDATAPARGSPTPPLPHPTEAAPPIPTTAGPSYLPMPKVAPARWIDRDKTKKETPPQFIKNHYGDWLGRGLTRAHIRTLDRSLYNALAVWLGGNTMPKDIDLPTLKEENDRWVDRVQRSIETTIGTPIDGAAKPLDRLRSVVARRSRIRD